MNYNPFWAGLALCLAATGCRLHVSNCQLRPAVSCAESPDSSGLACHNRLSESATGSTPAAERLPYGFRWDDYQGADIEHDIYGERRVSRYHCPAQSRVCGGLFAPACRTCAETQCTEAQSADLATDCGCATHAAQPVPQPPVPVPLADVPTPLEPTPVETAPMEVKPIDTAPAESTPAASIPVEPAPIEPAPVEPAPLEPTPAEPFIPPRNEVPKQVNPKPEADQQASSETRPAASHPLIPTQIKPAAPPPGLPIPKETDRSQNELKRNTVPANSAKGSTAGAKGPVGSFLYELLIGPK